MQVKVISSGKKGFLLMVQAGTNHLQASTSADLVICVVYGGTQLGPELKGGDMRRLFQDFLFINKELRYLML